MQIYVASSRAYLENGSKFKLKITSGT